MVWRKALGLAIAETGVLVRLVSQRSRRAVALAALGVGTIVVSVYAETSLFIAAIVVLICAAFVTLTVFTTNLVHHLLRLQFRIRETRFTMGLGTILGLSLCMLALALLLKLPLVGPELEALIR